MLTLAQDKGPVLVGRVDWKDANHMSFHIVGDGPMTRDLSSRSESVLPWRPFRP